MENSSTLVALETELKETELMLKQFAIFVNSVVVTNDELDSLLSVIRANQQAKMELLVAEYNKANPVNVGDEYISKEDALLSSFTPEEALRRTQAKKLARPLYSKFHPDKLLNEGNNYTWMGRRMFDVVRSAATDGNLLLLHYLTYKYGGNAVQQDLEPILSLAKARKLKLQGTPIMVCARMYAAGSPDTLAKTKKVLAEIMIKTTVGK
jgi:hypothetical protein